ncbi:MAG: hypothetical protein IJE07_14365 [Clostridia bacterium]|nr:hypothetical protein [Clostridia bacterium]
MKKILAVLLLIALLAPCCTALADTATYATTRAFLKALDEEGITYVNRGLDEDNDEYIIVYNMDENHSYTMDIFFEEDQEHTSIFVWYIIAFDEADLLKVMLACDTLNGSYNYTCFYVDETDNTVTCSMNLIYRDKNVDLVVMDAIKYMAAILELAYPVLTPYAM